MAIVLQLIVNYLYVQVGILLFTLPFYALYRRRAGSAGVHTTLNRHLELFFESRPANWLIFTWALAEAVTWFVIPEFLLLLIVFMRVQRKTELLIYDIAGTVVGTLIAFFIHLPAAQIERLPYITHNMLLQTQAWYSHFGMFGL